MTWCVHKVLELIWLIISAGSFEPGYYETYDVPLHAQLIVVSKIGLILLYA